MKSALPIVLLKANKLVKLTEVSRLFHALMTLLAKKSINTAVTTKFIQFACVSSRACKLRKLEKKIANGMYLSECVELM